MARNYERREALFRQWVAMWLDKRDTGIAELFADDARYIECWGPEYRGARQIKRWFDEWNTRGSVLRWEIGEFFHREDRTTVTWTFRNALDDGRAECFEGITLIGWTAEGRIGFLQEFGCRSERYAPYGTDGSDTRATNG